MVTNNAVPECVARRIARAKSEKEIDACVVELLKVAADPPNHIVKLVQRVLLPKSSGCRSPKLDRLEVLDFQPPRKNNPAMIGLFLGLFGWLGCAEEISKR
jgi:hypothetical protein